MDRIGYLVLLSERLNAKPTVRTCSRSVCSLARWMMDHFTATVGCLFTGPFPCELNVMMCDGGRGGTPWFPLLYLSTEARFCTPATCYCEACCHSALARWTDSGRTLSAYCTSSQWPHGVSVELRISFNRQSVIQELLTVVKHCSGASPGGYTRYTVLAPMSSGQLD